jgi:PAS domain S-box-containing protein
MEDEGGTGGALRAEHEALCAENERLRGRLEELERARDHPGPPLPAQGDEGAGPLPARALFEDLLVALAIYSVTGQLLAANRRRRQLPGAGGAPGSSFFATATPAQAEAFRRAARGATVRLPPAPLDPARPEPSEGGPGTWVEATYVGIDADPAFGPGDTPAGDAPEVHYVLEALLDATERHRVEDAIQERAGWYNAILDNAPLFIYAKDADGRYILANPGTLAYFGIPWEDLRGLTDHDVLTKAEADACMRADREVLSTGAHLESEYAVLLPDGLHHYAAVKFPLRGPDGAIRGVGGAGLDISSYRRAEEETRRLREEAIRAHDARLRALTAALLPVGSVLLVRLVGQLDPERGERLLEVLLEGLMAYNARAVILDAGAASSEDGEVARHVIKAAQAAKRLGAAVILAAIPAAVAQAMAALDADLNGLPIEETLQDAVARAMKR